MVIGIAAKIGIGILASVAKSVISGTPEKNAASTKPSPSLSPSSSVNISSRAATWGKNARTTDVTGKTPVDRMVAKAPDSVRKAWEKTKKELGLDTGNQAYYLNPLTITTAMQETRTKAGASETGKSGTAQNNFFGPSTSSAVHAVDGVIRRLNNQLPGYNSHSRERQAALEMYGTFRKHLMQA